MQLIQSLRGNFPFLRERWSTKGKTSSVLSSTSILAKRTILCARCWCISPCTKLTWRWMCARPVVAGKWGALLAESSSWAVESSASVGKIACGVHPSDLSGTSASASEERKLPSGHNYSCLLIFRFVFQPSEMWSTYFVVHARFAFNWIKSFVFLHKFDFILFQFIVVLKNMTWQTWQTCFSGFVQTPRFEGYTPLDSIPTNSCAAKLTWSSSPHFKSTSHH